MLRRRYQWLEEFNGCREGREQRHGRGILPKRTTRRLTHQQSGTPEYGYGQERLLPLRCVSIKLWHTKLTMAAGHALL
jgi:hypothetical protein